MDMSQSQTEVTLSADSINPRLLSLAMAFVPEQAFVTPYGPALIEYLDGHPTNAAALAYYSKMRAAYDQAASDYEDQFGPLTAREVDTRAGSWSWIDDPWPWEGADN